MLYVTQVSSDPGNDLEWSCWLVFQTELPEATVEKAVRDLILVIDEADSPVRIVATVTAELHRRGFSGIQVSSGKYVYMNS